MRAAAPVTRPDKGKGKSWKAELVVARARRRRGRRSWREAGFMVLLLCLLGAAVADADDDGGWRAGPRILTLGASKAQFRPPRDRPVDVGCEGGVRLPWLR